MLARKPGALRNVAPFHDWPLPPAIATPAPLRLTVEPIADCARYDGLCTEVNSGVTHAAP